MTGSASGIGRAITGRFVAGGARVLAAIAEHDVTAALPRLGVA